MFTFEDQIDLVKEETGIPDAAAVARFKRDTNRGASRFFASLGREYNRQSRTTNLEADRQYYQYPEDAQRVGLVISYSGGIYYPLTPVADEDTWRYINSTNQTGQPNHCFVRGFDEIGLYPIPSADVTDGLEIVYEPRGDFFRADDTTGTCLVTNGSRDVTGVATPFTPNMVGRGFEITDDDGTRWYRISGFTSTSIIQLENYYQGTTGAAKPFRIGQVMNLPEEYLEAPSYWAIYRHHRRRGQSKKADVALAEFVRMRDEAQEEYGQQMSTQVILASEDNVNRSFNYFRGDSVPSITA